MHMGYFISKQLVLFFFILISYSHAFAQSKQITTAQMEDSLAMIVATAMAEGNYFESTAYINEDFGFLILFPVSWEYKEKYKDNLLYAYSKNNTTDNFSACAISILEDTMNSNIDTSALAQLSYLKSTYTMTQEPTIKKTTIRGNELRKISISTKIKEQNINMDIYLALRKHYYYCVSFTTSANEKNNFSADIDKIINTFTIVR